MVLAAVTAGTRRETEWITRHMGQQAWDVVWGPLMRGKFGERAPDISMAWIWDRSDLVDANRAVLPDPGSEPRVVAERADVQLAQPAQRAAPGCRPCGRSSMIPSMITKGSTFSTFGPR